MTEEKKQKLVHQLFIGKVADVIGIEKTTELLKEAKGAINFTDSSLQLKEEHKKYIDDLEKELKEIENDEDFRLGDNAEWVRQIAFINGQLRILLTL